jgi:biotin operon repressor
MSPSDPPRQIRLDVHNLRGIAHPVRLRILSLLRNQGSATAPDLARCLDLSTAVINYHLRQLAEHGFIVNDPVRDGVRHQWWQAAHADTVVPSELTQTVDGPGVVFLRTAACVWSDDMIRAINVMPTLPPEWRRALDFSDYGLWLTPAQARDLIRHVHAEVRKYRTRSRPVMEAVRYTVQLQMFPTLGGDYPEAEEEL